MADQKKFSPSERKWGPSFYLPLALIVSVFGAIVGFVTLDLRGDLREQIILSKAQSLLPLAQFQIDRNQDDEIFELMDAEDIVILSLLDTYDMDGALGLQLFDHSGQSVLAAPEGVRQNRVDRDILKRVKDEGAFSVFHQEANAGEYFGGELEVAESAETVPLLEMYLKVKYKGDNRYLGVVRYLMDGSETMQEYGALDGKLGMQASVAFLSGTALIGGVFWFALMRLKLVNRQLREKAEGLATANAELALVAKTSAIGAVTSHLIHGLKNPLAGLREHVATGGKGLEGDDWQDAEQAARRMQEMINEVVDVLKSEGRGVTFSIEADEIVDQLRQKFDTLAKRKGILFEASQSCPHELSEKVGSIAILILSNLVQNALEATRPGGAVSVEMAGGEKAVEALVSDTGPGFSQEARDGLFQPGKSGKPTGAGIGLAISKQLARHIDANLELITTSSHGTVMKLRILI